VPFRIIGIAPRGFQGLIAGQSPRLYVPIATYADLNPNWRGYEDWGLRWLNPFVRLPSGVALQTAEAQLQMVYRGAVRQELNSEGPQSQDYLKELSHERAFLIPASHGDHAQLDNWSEPLRVLQWMTLAVLLLAAINVAGLMLVRAVKHKQEILIRYAVGATRSAVMRLHLLQTVILALLGGLLGLWIARFGAQLLVHLARMDRGNAFIYRPHGWTLVLHWAGALLIGLLVGILPAWQTARIDLASGLSEGALTHSATRSQALARRLLAAAQIALSLVLVVAAGLFSKALHKLVSVPVGFHPERLTVFSVDPKFARSTIQSTELLWANLQHRLKDTPGVQAVTYGTGGPFPQGADVALVTPGAHSDPTNHHQSGTRSIIGPGYFSTLGIRILSGREFDDRDRAHTPGAVIINETLAHKLFGTADAVGQTVTMFNGLDPNWLATVVGVVADHHQSWRRANASLIYTPALQATRADEMTYYVRTKAAALPEPTIRDIVRREAPAISPYDIATMETRMAEFASGDRAMTILVGTFALLALVIAAVGIYGVVAYGASLRTLEFGIRVSLGAQPANILWLVLREAVLILAAGIIMAAPLTYFGLSIARHQLQAISLHEPAIYFGAILLLALCTLIAAEVPARRATRMSVHGAMRYR
jgi:putative ABC transport system permease protein